MSDHRSSRSRHRDAPGRHRTLARGGRAGILIAAVVTTAAVAVVGLIPYASPDSSSASSDDAGVAEKSSLLGGLREIVDGIGDDTAGTEQDAAPVPAKSGHGRRVVFDKSDQRVWIVGAGDKVRTTYLVSGSETNNLEPGAYRVYSRSRHAVGFDYHSTMQYFVRFAEGRQAAIGFHDIPVDQSGQRIQSFDELGTPQSAGCIRQRRSDARTMWRFAGIDTRVVVTT
ncbi:MAG: L,D-transpeptidase [Nocardioidaceae bacterium]